MRPELDLEPRARIPADVEAPDKLIYGLTARQAAILAVAAATAYLLYRSLAPHVSPLVLVVALTPLAAAAVVLALGCRDGLSMDAFLWVALRHRRSPKTAVPAPVSPVPGWAPAADTLIGASPALLRLPASAIADSGIVDAGGHAAALVAATTVNIGLRTGDEQAALVEAFGRWLNSLTAPAQVVVSARRVDLAAHAARIAEAAETVTNPALAEAAADYAAFLEDLAARRDPLWRTVTVVLTAAGAHRDTEVARRAEHSAAALGALGVNTRVLDACLVTGLLASAADPYTGAWPRAHPGQVITTGSSR